MELEQLKKQIIQEGVAYFKLRSKMMPYVQFGNFVESLRRNENTALIESIQAGILTILEGYMEKEYGSDSMLKRIEDKIKSGKITADMINQLIENNDTGKIMELLYPFVIRSIDKMVVKDNPNALRRAEEVLTKAVDKISKLASEMKPIVGEGQEAGFLQNYASKFIVGPLVSSMNRPTGAGKQQAGKMQAQSVTPEEGNKSQFVRFVDESKREGIKEWGRPMEFKTVDGVPMTRVQWKDKKTQEWIPAEDLDTYNIINREEYNTVSFDSDEGTEDNVSLKERVASEEIDLAGEGRISDILTDINETLLDMGVDENMQKAVMAYYEKVVNMDKEELKRVQSRIQALKKGLERGYVIKQGGDVAKKEKDPNLDTPEKIEKAIEDAQKSALNMAPPKMTALGSEFGVKPADLKSTIAAVNAEMQKELA